MRAFLGKPGLWWMFVVVWASILFFLSSQSDLPKGPDIPFKDKIEHAIYFCGGSFCLVMALFCQRLNRSNLSIILTGLAFGAVVGALDEWHQTFTPGRSGNDPWDWTADVTGSLLGAWLAIKIGLFLFGKRGTTGA